MRDGKLEFPFCPNLPCAEIVSVLEEVCVIVLYLGKTPVRVGWFTSLGCLSKIGPFFLLFFWGGEGGVAGGIFPYLYLRLLSLSLTVESD